MVAPFSNIWKKILNFIKFALIGVLFNTVMKWFGNPANNKKIEAIGRFFKDWWPALLTGAALFLTPLGALVAASVNLMAWAIPALLTSIAANPWAAAILATGATAAYLSTQKNETDKKVDESVEKKGKEQTVSDLKEEKASKNVFQRMGGFFTGEGQEREEQIQKVETGTQKRYGFFGELDRPATKFNKGGTVPGTGNTDTVPAMLTPGEFVMSKGAVQQYGVDTLQGMNAAAGGTNIPQLKKVKVPHYQEGGSVNIFNPMTWFGGGKKLDPVAGRKYDPKHPEGTRQPNPYKPGTMLYNVFERHRQYDVMGMLEYNQGGLVQHNEGENTYAYVKGYQEGGEVISFSSETKVGPVGTPIVHSTNKTITLPTIPKQDQSRTRSNSDVPMFRIPIQSSQRSMVIASLGIQDLMGG
jgi:hypothetical protein